MAVSYPRKQTVLVTIICALAVAGSAWYVANGTLLPRGTETGSEKPIQVIQTGTRLASTTDWQQQFFANATSSIFNTAADIDLAFEEDTASDEPETATGQFGKKFFERFMVLKQNDLNEDPEAVKATIDTSLDDLIADAPQARVFTIRETIPAGTSDSTAVRAYANTIGSIFQTKMPQGDAAITATKALEDQDESLIAEVEIIAAAYANMRDAVLVTPVPNNLAALHVNLINSLSAMNFVSEGMTEVFTDPIQGIVATANYEKAIGSLRDALLDYKYYFAQQGMTFSAGEAATIFSRVQ